MEPYILHEVSPEIRFFETINKHLLTAAATAFPWLPGIKLPEAASC
jgi:hypothetical protein